MDHQEYRPLCSLEANPFTGFPDAVDSAHVGAPNQTIDGFAQCMRPLGQPEAGLSVITQIELAGAQRPAYTPTSTLRDGHPRKHADLPQLSSQSRLPTVPHPHPHFSPLLPLSASTEPSLLAANSRPQECPSSILAIATESTTTTASVSQLAISADERSDTSAPLRTQRSIPSPPTPGVAKTCDYFGPCGTLVPSSLPSSSATQRRIPLLADPALCALVYTSSEHANDSPDHAGTRHMRLDPMPSVSFVVQANFSHATTIATPNMLGTLPASEADTDSAIGTMDFGHTSPTTSCSCLTLLPLDVRPPHNIPHEDFLVLDVPSDAARGLLGPEIPDDPMTEDETPPFGRLPPSSLPASQVSEFSLAADHIDIVPVSNAACSGSGDESAMLGHQCIGIEDSVTEAQVPVTTDALASDSYDSAGTRLILGSSIDEDAVVGLRASSPPSSSPPGLFSSPTPSLSGSPPSSSPVRSPCDVEDHLPTPTILGGVPTSQSSPSKRARMADELSNIAVTSSLESRPPKRMKTELSPPTTLPNPIRPTQASQAKQRKKLAAPFRSPVIKGPLVRGGLHAVYAFGRATASRFAPKPLLEGDTTIEAAAAAAAAVEPHIQAANKDRTARAAKQFKPPMQVAEAIAPSQSSSTIATSAVSRVGAAPTIQALQGQIQTLKQAIKIKHFGNGNDDEALEQLVEKWTTVGREVAWALWEHVKDLDPGTGAPPQGGWYVDDEDGGVGLKRGFEPGWGYEDDEARKKARMDEDFEQEEPLVAQHTVGVMLRRLGIDPDTLGWNEDEGDFVDM